MYWFHKIVFTLRNIIDLSEISFRWTDDIFYVFYANFGRFITKKNYY